jgi:hypothetical protein
MSGLGPCRRAKPEPAHLVLIGFLALVSIPCTVQADSVKTTDDRAGARRSVQRSRTGAGFWEIPDQYGPLGDWGPGHTAWADVAAAVEAFSDPDVLHDAGIALLQASSDQTWGLYSLAARSLVASLRLTANGGARASALYHLGFAIQSLREHAGSEWRGKAKSAFTIAALESPVEGSFEGLAWFYITNGDSHGALRVYTLGLDVLCQPAGTFNPGGLLHSCPDGLLPHPRAGFGPPPPGVERACQLSPTFIYRHATKCPTHVHAVAWRRGPST